MNADFSDVQCHPGDEAVSSDEHKLGKIVAIDARFVTVEHGHLSKGRYYVPRHALDARIGQTVYLNVTKAQADHGDWGSAPARPAARAPLAAPDAWAQPSPPPPTPAPAAPAPAAPAASWTPPAVEPSVNDLRPMLAPDVENEPMLLLDTTGSMSYPVAADSTVQRREVIGEAIGRIVETLAAQDSQAAKEQAAGEEAGGLMTITFAGGAAQCIEDLNPANWRQKWRAIAWGGGTQIMPGWRQLMETYQDEFGALPESERPRLLALIITDGEADDTADFAHTLAQAAGEVYVCVAILGFGGEHDQALAAYRRIAATNDHVRVVTFGSETDPSTIADGLLSLLGRAA